MLCYCVISGHFFRSFEASAITCNRHAAAREQGLQATAQAKALGRTGDKGVAYGDGHGTQEMNPPSL